MKEEAPELSVTALASSEYNEPQTDQEAGSKFSLPFWERWSFLSSNPQYKMDLGWKVYYEPEVLWVKLYLNKKNFLIQKGWEKFPP